MHTSFEISGYQARIDGRSVVLFQGSDHVATVTFRPDGIFTITERGRGDAGRLPAALFGDVEGAVAYIIKRFWPSKSDRRVAA